MLLQACTGSSILTSPAADPTLIPPCCHLLVAGVRQAVYDTAQPDVQQPDLSVQVVDFLFQRTHPASPAPVRSHGSRHEVDRHDEAEWQHRALRVTLELLQDVEARQSKEGDSC